MVLQLLPPSLTNFNMLQLLVTPKLTLDSLFDQNQIIVPVIPKLLFFEEKKFSNIASWSSDLLAIRKKLSGNLRYFRMKNYNPLRK